MNPLLSNIITEDEVLKFTLSGLNVSLANALRRIILSEIPIAVFLTDYYNDNKCIIEENTSRLHNEIIRQRLGCIPIHEKDLEVLTDKYILEVDVSNDTDNILYVTTEHFKIKNKLNGNYLTEEETHRIFPKNNITQSYIDFVRLRPKISDSIPGEKIKLKCEFSVSDARYNSMYNVVSKCAYSNTHDITKIDEVWSDTENKLLSTDVSKEEIEFQKKNFYLLDAQKYFIPDSFDFVIQSIGVYDNEEIVKKGCVVLQNKFIDFINQIDSDTVPIVLSESCIANSYDIILENEDYTMGKVIEYLLYENYYVKEEKLSYCGFKKMHPHNNESIIRIAFIDNVMDKNTVRQLLRSSCVDAQNIFKKIFSLF